METSRQSDIPVEEQIAALQEQDAQYRGMVTWEDPSRIPAPNNSGDCRHPLQGRWLPIKDLVDTSGLRTTYGLSTFRDHVPEDDHPVVARLRAHGAIVIGKSNTPSYGALPVTESELHGMARNPRDPSRISGGSSGGAAVLVAAGTFSLAHGTDAAGSLRIPAACCGIVGWKSTPGLLPHDPASLSEHRGIHTHGFLAGDTALLQDVAISLGASGRVLHPSRLVVLDGRPFGGGRTPYWEAAISQCWTFGEKLSCTVEMLELPEEDAVRKAFQLFWMHLASPGTVPDDSLESHLVAWRTYAREHGAAAVQQAVRLLEAFRQRIEQRSSPGTVFIHPTLGIPVPDAGMRERFADPFALFAAGVELSPLGAVANLLRRPAVSFPLAHLDAPGIPVSATLVGPRGSDAALLGLVAVAQEARMGHQHQPEDVC